MSSITPAQIRGACGLLDWSRLDLAKAAHLSVSVVVNAAGRDPGRTPPNTLAAIRTALEAGGVRFGAVDDGIELRANGRQPSVFSRFM